MYAQRIGRRVQQSVDVVQLPVFTQYAGLPPDPCLVLADATQRHQIMMNFAANAEHAMRGTGGRLVVRLEPVAVD
jgi:signal transduction histidine kinase